MIRVRFRGGAARPDGSSPSRSSRARLGIASVPMYIGTGDVPRPTRIGGMLIRHQEAWPPARAPTFPLAGRRAADRPRRHARRGNHGTTVHSLPTLWVSRSDPRSRTLASAPMPTVLRAVHTGGVAAGGAAVARRSPSRTRTNPTGRPTRLSQTALAFPFLIAPGQRRC